MSEPQSGRRARATIDDVAARAGVSVATVSRALRGLPNVATATRRRIEQAAADLRYRPDPAAARLAAGRTNTVTIGIPQLDGWYFSTVVAGAEEACTEAGYLVQVIGIKTPADLERLIDPSERLERRTDALALVDIDLGLDDAAHLLDRGVVVGTIGFHVPGHPAVQLDDHGVGAIAADHLVEVGCERPAIIAGTPDAPMRGRVPGLRLRGFESALGAADIDLGGRVAAGVFGVEGGRRAAAELLDRHDAIDGVFAMSDELAFGALMELRSRGIPTGAGPGAVAVIGVDDHEFSAVVELTTVRQEVRQHGHDLACRMIAVLRQHQLDAHHPPHPMATGDDGGARSSIADVSMRSEPAVTLVRRASTAPRHTA